MNKETELWLEKNLSVFTGAGNRVKYGKLNKSYEDEFGANLDNAELCSWLERKNMTTAHIALNMQKAGRKGGRKKRGVVRRVRRHRRNGAALVSNRALPEAKFKKIEAYEIDGQIFVPFDSTKRS